MKKRETSRDFLQGLTDARKMSRSSILHGNDLNAREQKDHIITGVMKSS